MIKLVCVIERREEVAREDFYDWWMNHHAPLVAQMPGLLRYSIATPTEEDANIDGVAELYFESETTMDEAFNSDVGRQVSQEDVEVIGRRVAYVLTERVFVEH